MFERAVDAARSASSDDDHDAVWSMLIAVGDDPAALEAAVGHLHSKDSAVRATACDLVRVICERHEDARERAVAALLELVGQESDVEVLSSGVRALGATATDRAIPALLAQARSASEEVRLAVAVALPACSVESAPPAVVTALIELTDDRDDDVRNWATFALGRQLEVDSAALRDALWERVSDESPDVREEAIAGLARRRDRRSLPLVAQLLDSGDVPSWLFDAAASLADASLVPRLLKYGEEDELVMRALSCCDPARRTAREHNIAALVVETQRLLDECSPGAVVATWCDLLDIDVVVGVRVNGDERLGSADHILAAAGNDPFRAAQRWVEIVTATDDSRTDQVASSPGYRSVDRHDGPLDAVSVEDSGKHTR